MTDRGTLLAEQARARDRRALARLLTEVENRTAAGESGLRQLYPLAGGAHLVGVTGAPGSRRRLHELWLDHPGGDQIWPLERDLAAGD